MANGCLVSVATPPGDPLRLVGGSTTAEGRLEIYHNGEWGTVCDDFWNKPDATVVCHQLGFYGEATALTASQFGQGQTRLSLPLHTLPSHTIHTTLIHYHSSFPPLTHIPS